MHVRVHAQKQGDGFLLQHSLTCGQGVSSAPVQSFIFSVLFTLSNNRVAADCEEKYFLLNFSEGKKNPCKLCDSQQTYCQ